MLDNETKRRIDTARNILVGKVPDPKSQVEQITIALIYKFMNDMDAVAEELGGSRTFFSGEFERYSWNNLMAPGMGGYDVLNLYAEKISAGKHPAIVDENVVEMIESNGFYISKFEISNEQFFAFINNDGYEIEEYWIIKKGIMKNTTVGWLFQGKYYMNFPRDWDMSLKEPWKNSNSSFIFGPVVKLSWFESAAFCKWMKAELPQKDNIQIYYALETFESDSLYSPVCADIVNGGRLHFQPLRRFPTSAMVSEFTDKH